MSRRAADATRFTSTSPQTVPGTASTSQSSSPPNSQPVRPRNRVRSSITGSTIEIPTTAAPANETPYQKVERLRAAARQAKLDQESNLDRAIARGRVVADFLHRWTVRSLLFLSVASIGIAGYSTFDMLVYNRRKRREWLAQQQSAYESALARAITAREEGTLTSDQALILNKELALQQADEENKNAKSLARRGKDWLFSGLQKEEQRGGRLGVGVAGSGHEGKHEVAAAPVTISDMENIGTNETILRRIDQTKGTKTSANLPGGGPLDQLGDASARRIEDNAKTWFDWVSRRSDGR